MARNQVMNEIFENLQNGEIIFRNFAGRPDAYNQSGKRQYGIVLSPDRANDLKAKGWNVKTLAPREPGDDGLSFLPVEVNYGPYPPKCFLLSGSFNADGGIDILTKTPLDETTIGELDHANFACADIIVTPYVWEWNGRSGIKAYTKAMYVTVVLDQLELKYADVGNPQPIYEDMEIPFN